MNYRTCKNIAQITDISRSKLIKSSRTVFISYCCVTSRNCTSLSTCFIFHRVKF